MQLLYRRPLASAACLFLLSSALFSVLPSPARWIVLGVLSVLAFLFARRFRAMRGIFISAVILLLLFSLLFLAFCILPVKRIEKNSENPGILCVTVREVLDRERGIYGGESVSLNDHSLSCRVIFRLHQPVSPGDVLSGVGEVRAFTSFEINTYRSRGYHGVISFSEKPEPLSHQKSLHSVFSTLPKHFRERLLSVSDGESGALMAALLLGETDHLSGQTTLLFRRLGISHMLAISGMHLLVLSSALTYLLKRIGLPKVSSSVLVLLFLLFYAALTGFTPSILRAAIMATASQVAYLSGREHDPFSALFLSSPVILLLQPHRIFSLSFWLSFTATLGILVFSSLVNEQRIPSLARIPKGIRRYLLFPTTMTVAAVLFTLPITVGFFGQFSLMTLPSNLLLALPVEGMLCLSLLCLVIGANPITSAVAGFYGRMLIRFARFLASGRNLLLSVSHPVILGFSVLLLVLLLILFLLPRRFSRSRLTVPATISCFSLLIISLLLFSPPKSVAPSVLYLTDGKNDAILLCEDTHRTLIDCGGGTPSALTEVSLCLSEERICELDGYVLTHYHEGQEEALLRSLALTYVHRVYLSPATNAGEQRILASVISALERAGIPYTETDGTLSYAGFTVSVSERIFRFDGGHPDYAVSVRQNGKQFAYVSAGALAGRESNLFPGVPATYVALGAHGDSPSLPIFYRFPDTTEALVLSSPYWASCTYNLQKAARYPFPCRVRFPFE